MDDVLGSVLKTPETLFKDKMAYSTLIDLGVVTDVIDNKAVVKSVRLINNMNVVYSDVEIVYPSGIKTSVLNSVVLLFVPVSCVPDIATMDPIQSVSPFDSKGMKAIPISNQKGDINVGLFNKEFSVIANAYKFFGNTEGINFTSKDIKAVVTDSYLQLTMGGIDYVLSSEGVTKIVTNNSQLKYIEKHNSDGSIAMYYGPEGELSEEEYIDPSSYENWTWVKEFKSNGEIKITRKDDVTIFINSANEIEVNVHGAVLKIGNDGLFEISNDSGSLGDILKGLIEHLIGLKIVCPNGAGSVDPSSVTDLTGDLTNLGNLLKINATV